MVKTLKVGDNVYCVQKDHFGRRGIIEKIEKVDKDRMFTIKWNDNDTVSVETARKIEKVTFLDDAAPPLKRARLVTYTRIDPEEEGLSTDDNTEEESDNSEGGHTEETNNKQT